MNNSKLNGKDIAAGLFFVLLAIAGLWLNQDHALGSARRMGPGYMPMLVFWILMGLGVIVLLTALVSGPDPLQKWTGIESASFAAAIIVGYGVYLVSPNFGPHFSQTYNGIGIGMLAGFLILCIAQGWAMLGYICAAMCVFSLLLESGGLMLSITGTVAVCALAEPGHRERPLGVLGVLIFLLALCWWIFIDQLDIRVPVWPWSL